jgi:RNA polymerase sigma-70 factor (ECF subfamily)
MSHPANGLQTDDFETTLQLAKQNCTESLGRLLEPCRQYLLLIANQELNPALTAKVGASDLVQDTFLTARHRFCQFLGSTEQELMGWLRQVLLNHLLTVQRRYIETAKRTTYREVSLNGSFQPIAEILPADVISPSKHCMRGELAEIVNAALARLPDRYREVINLRHRHALPFDDVARRLEITSQAARQVWTRAIQRLQKELRAAELI